MDEDDLFAGSMEIDDPAVSPASRAAVHVSAPRPGVDEDMSEVAQIMLNLKVRPSSCRMVICGSARRIVVDDEHFMWTTSAGHCGANQRLQDSRALGMQCV